MTLCSIKGIFIFNINDIVIVLLIKQNSLLEVFYTFDANSS